MNERNKHTGLVFTWKQNVKPEEKSVDAPDILDTDFETTIKSISESKVQLDEEECEGGDTRSVQFQEAEQAPKSKRRGFNKYP